MLAIMVLLITVFLCGVFMGMTIMFSRLKDIIESDGE